MARLHIQPGSPGGVSRELGWGVTRVGRAPDNDLILDHPSVSQHHCELELGQDGLRIRDLGSTNGTYVGGRMISQSEVPPGAALRFGELPALAEWSQESVVVPEIQIEKRPDSIDLGEGMMSCCKHPAQIAVWACDACRKYFCPTCPRNVHLVGRPSRWTCPECGAPVTVAPWADPNRNKKSLWGKIKSVFTSA